MDIPSLVAAHENDRLKEWLDTCLWSPSLLEWVLNVSAHQGLSSSLQLGLVRQSLLICCRSPLLLKAIERPAGCVRWACGIAADGSLPAPTRGAALSILTLLTKHNIIKEDALLELITDAVVVNLQWLHDAALAETSQGIVFMQGEIILHQCTLLTQLVEEYYRDKSSDDCKLTISLLPLLKLLSPSCKGLFSDSAQVDLCKILVSIGETAKRQKIISVNSISIKDSIFQSCSLLVGFVSSSSILHDVYQGLYMVLLEVLDNVLSLEFVSDQLTLMEKSFREIFSIENASVLNIQRGEALLGLVSCLFERSVDLSLCVDTCAESALNGLIVPFVSEMKLNYSSSSKDAKSLFVEARKGCIACAHSILSACRLYTANNCLELLKSLSLQTLSTPLLFPPIYIAASALFDQDKLRHVVAIISDHLLTALRSVGKYSVASAADVVTAVDELAEHNYPFFALNESDANFLIRLLDAYKTFPKFQKLSSVKDLNWKQITASTLVKLILQARSVDNTKISLLLVDVIDTFQADYCNISDALGNHCQGSNSSSASDERRRKEAVKIVISSFKTSEPEDLVELLSSISGSYLSLIQCDPPLGIFVGYNNHIHAQLNSFCRHVCTCLRRKLLFDDDAIQFGNDLDLVHAIVSRIYSESFAKQEDHSNDQNLFLFVFDSLVDVILNVIDKNTQIGEAMSRILATNALHIFILLIDTAVAQSIMTSDRSDRIKSILSYYNNIISDQNLSLYSVSDQNKIALRDSINSCFDIP